MHLHGARLLLPFIGALLLGGCHGHAPSPAEVDLIVDVLEIESGTTVADVGAGDGDYAITLAARVGPDGSVFATELGEASVAALRTAVAAASVEGTVQIVTATETSTGLPEACCDAILLRHVYHHLTAPEATLASLYRAMQPGARLLVVDFPSSVWLAPWDTGAVPGDRTGHGISPKTVIREATAAGFHRLDLIEDWPGDGMLDSYGVVLEKP